MGTVGIGVLAFFAFSEDFEISSGGGMIMFIPIAICLFLAVIIIGIHSTYDAIGHERREGTLSLIYLTGLEPQEFLIAKLAVNGLRNIWAILATLPIPVSFGILSFGSGSCWPTIGG